jgi:endonuclease/exonuclease/phosphatase (EEP) superfamily protein YafD
MCCAVLLLFSGCVSIPASHFTVEQDGYICSVNGECLCENAVLPDRYIDAAAQVEGLDPERIVLLNWNSHKETGLQWLQELQRMITGVDLLTLQEGVLTSELRDLLSDEYDGGWILANAFTKSDVHTGVLTASKVQHDFFCSFRVAEPIIVVPKTVLISRYPIAGTTQTLLLVNMHMVNFSFATDAYREQLRNAFDLINQHQGPLLISGDFNSWSDERDIIIQHFANALGAEAVQFPVDGRTTFLGHVLDHIFYRGLEPVESTVETEPLSDHNPMLVTFRLAGDMFAWSKADE